jgi:outer membrane protein OmpA-like peptidoglycan-associated protein
MRGILTILWALLAAALGWFAASYKAPAIQQDILTRSTEAVKPLNANAEVLVDGRFVTVRGPELSEETKAKTLAAADGVWGALGPTDGLWVKVAAKALEFFSAEKTADGSLTLTGSASSEETKAALEAAARSAFGGTIDNQIVVAEGTNPTNKLPDLGQALNVLSGLDIGSLTATADRVRLSGVTGRAAAAEAATALQAAAPDLVQVFVQGPTPAAPAPADDASAARISQLESQVTGLTSELDAARKRIAELLGQLEQAPQPAPPKPEPQPAPAPAPEPEPAPAPQPAPPPAPVPTGPEEVLRACNEAVAGILQGSKVEFDTAKATIRPEGVALIDKLIAAAKPCLNNPALRVTVGGHTDSQGEAAKNLKLSQDRAEAVKAALAARGIASDDITAIGFGESMPIADNATEEGRQANRRITIEWSLR